MCRQRGSPSLIKVIDECIALNLALIYLACVTDAFKPQALSVFIVEGRQLIRWVKETNPIPFPNRRGCIEAGGSYPAGVADQEGYNR